MLDEYLKTDPESRVACNTFVTMGLVLVGGQITTTALFDVEQVVRQLGNDIGYTSPKFGFDINTATILRSFHRQSADINLGVTKTGGEIGAGDQGMMFGFACHGRRSAARAASRHGRGPDGSKAEAALKAIELAIEG